MSCSAPRLSWCAADGMANKTLAERLATTRMSVLLWRSRYAEEEFAGILEDRSRPGRPKEISPDEEAEIVEATRSTKPKNATHRTVRTLARDQGVSPASVHRIWRATDYSHTGWKSLSSAAIRNSCTRYGDCGVIPEPTGQRLPNMT